jgi:hypothetical protein
MLNKESLKLCRGANVTCYTRAFLNVRWYVGRNDKSLLTCIKQAQSST